MVRLILTAIVVFLVVRALSRLVGGILQGAGYTAKTSQPPSVGLVKDPVCGTFVAPSHALTAGSGNNVKFFCSEKCRSEWNKR
jgi:YHS domain-containing protein